MLFSLEEPRKPNRRRAFYIHIASSLESFGKASPSHSCVISSAGTALRPVAQRTCSGLPHLRVVVAAKRPAAAWRSPASPRRAPAMLRRCSEEDATEAADDEEEGPGWSIRCSRRISSPREAKPSRAPRKLQAVTSLHVHNPAYSTSFTSRAAEAGEAIRLLAIARTTPLLHPRSSAATRRAPAPERG